MEDTWTFNELLADIRGRRRFAFSRYGDGEWNCIFGREGHIVNHEHTYSQSLGAALAVSLRTGQNYHVGIMDGLLVPGEWRASDRVIAWKAAHPEVAFCSSLLLHRASIHGRLGHYFEALRGQRLVLVANHSASAMRPWLGCFEHIEVPANDCWCASKTLLPRILSACREPGVVMFACSMPAKVWIRQAWDDNGLASLVDIGSVFDPYTGTQSRSYMRDNPVTLANPIYPELSTCTSK